MPKLRLKQLAQDGATSGQVVTFNTVAGEWEAHRLRQVVRFD